MKILNPYYQILDPIDPVQILTKLEKCGRICYKSESKITKDSAKKFLANLIRSGHHSVIEHVNISVLFVTNRGVTHELVRHRLASYSQESTRYCNYGNENEITVIEPPFWERSSYQYTIWHKAMKDAESAYLDLIDYGAKPQEARDVLPNSLKTEIIATANIREWRHILKLRCAKNAHPEIRQVMIPLLFEFRENIPVLFDDIYNLYFEKI